ncbi:MAG TPA: DUF2231 domain-containing protein [Bacteroidota bacterium]
MSSPASLKDHPIHPLLITLPVGMWVFSLASDIIYAAQWGGPVWADVAFYAMIGGVVGALLAAIPGFVDYFSISDEKTKRTATKHMVTNLSVVVLYVINIIIRANNPNTAALPILLSVIGVGAIVYSGWLGGDMVYEHGMAVELEADGRLAKGRPRPYEPAGQGKVVTTPERRAAH